MAKTKNKTIQNPKPKTSIFLCCFGAPPKKASMESITEGSDPTKKAKRTSWISWVRIRIRKNSASKTVPLEAHYSKAKSKSTLRRKSQAPTTNPPPSTQPLPGQPATPYYTPSQTRHGGSNNAENTRQQGRDYPTQSKRQGRRASSSMQPQRTTKKHKNARGSYDPVVGMSVIVVTLVIMIFWGRLCAILCTSAWLYYIPRFRKSGAENDESDSGKRVNDVDLDSEEYKKKVIMEGLLERNHRERGNMNNL